MNTNQYFVVKTERVYSTLPTDAVPFRETQVSEPFANYASCLKTVAEQTNAEYKNLAPVGSVTRKFSRGGSHCVQTVKEAKGTLTVTVSIERVAGNVPGFVPARIGTQTDPGYIPSVAGVTGVR